MGDARVFVRSWLLYSPEPGRSLDRFFFQVDAYMHVDMHTHAHTLPTHDTPNSEAHGRTFIVIIPHVHNLQFGHSRVAAAFGLFFVGLLGVCVYIDRWID